jgi:hypothetical protein
MTPAESRYLTEMKQKSAMCMAEGLVTLNEHWKFKEIIWALKDYKDIPEDAKEYMEKVNKLYENLL